LDNAYRKSGKKVFGRGLYTRFLEHFYFPSKCKIKRPLYRAIIKYGRDNFFFHILEYTAPEITRKRETY